jgi:hypothetical protein
MLAIPVFHCSASSHPQDNHAPDNTWSDALCESPVGCSSNTHFNNFCFETSRSSKACTEWFVRCLMSREHCICLTRATLQGKLLTYSKSMDFVLWKHRKRGNDAKGLSSILGMSKTFYSFRKCLQCLWVQPALTKGVPGAFAPRGKATGP